VEIVLLLALAALLGFAETHLHAAAVVVEVLVIAAVNYTIARVIHAEAIPGHNQFWITRPYRWNSLLTAKILFILVFVNLPLFAAQCYMIVNENFSFAANFAGLIWSQILLVSCVSLPAACLASLTANLMPFLLSEFMLAGAVLIAEGLHARAVPSAFLPAMQSGPAAVDWVRDSLVLIVITCFAVYVLRSQYKTRMTELGDRYAIGGAVVALLVFLCMPWAFALGVQAELSKQAFDASSLNVSLGPVTKGVFPFPGPRDKPHPGEISLPFLIRGVAGDRELQADALSFRIVAADGRTWNSGSIAPVMVDTGPPIPGATVVAEILHLDPAFFEAESPHPVTLQTRLYLTLFGDAQSMTIPIQPSPGVNVMDGLQCFAGLFNQLNCRSIFRWPRRRVDAKTGDGDVESHIRSVSYSPFPAEFGFNPIEQHSFQGATSATHATVTTTAPLSYFHVDAEMTGISLLDYTVEARRRALMAPPPGIR
jgi:hypothetical protein